ncbi:beta-N-acetylhexosaminidase [bacterium]|nr:beta-N-acetylhexosaminidase [bacterium]
MKRWLGGIVLAACIAVLLPACAEMMAKKNAGKAGNVGIIPAPAQCELGRGHFAVTPGTEIYANSSAGQLSAKFLKDGIKERTGLNLKVNVVNKVGQSHKGAIVIEPGLISSKNPEAYELTVTPRGIKVTARAETGLFYGVQSVLQMVDAHLVHYPVVYDGPAWPLNLPAVKIADEPRFGYRGMMLDESRHFFGMKAVKECLDMMAGLKMNRFHWHLTDSQGWRVEIKKDPKLTTVGGTERGIDPNVRSYYTQDEIREIVAYAAERQIVIIPEIDMPGHATAATKAYPEISGGDDPKYPGFTFNPAKEETYEFLTDVMRELATMFPGPYVNIGGDEVFFGNTAWKTDPQILAFTRAQGLKNEVELEHYFIRRMAGNINKMGKIVMGWDDIGAAGIDPNQSALLWWHHEKPQVLTKGVEDGFPVVLCPRDPCYFDFIQYEGLEVGRKEYGGKKVTNTIQSVYNFPDRWTDKLVPEGRMDQVMGVEACVWTESISTMKRLQYILYPRLAALAEDGWTPAANKNIDDFMKRVPAFLRQCDRKGIYYFNPFDPEKTPEAPGPIRKVEG